MADQAGRADQIERILKRVREAGERFNAVITMTDDRARELWEAGSAPYPRGASGSVSDSRLSAGKPELRMPGHERPLAGVPLAVKDIVDVAGYRTSVGSRVDIRPGPSQMTAPAVSALEALGAVTVAKANCQEFSYSIVGDESAYGRSVNPAGSELITGGSSNGSAVLVAAGAVPLAVGTDTAGSVRVPAACCGVVGFKPTHGALSSDGVFPLAPTCDTVGLLGADVAIVARAWAGLVDSGAVEQVNGEAGKTLSGPSAPGVLAIAGDVPAEVRTSILAGGLGGPSSGPITAAQTFARKQPDRSAEWEAVFATAGDLYEPIRRFEANRATRHLLDSQRERFIPAVGDRLAGDAQVTAGEYEAALAGMRELRAKADALMGETDLLITPAFAGAVPTWDEADAEQGVSGRLIHYTVPFNVLGWPALTMPVPASGSARADATARPRSVQLAARPGRDALLLDCAAAVLRGGGASLGSC